MKTIVIVGDHSRNLCLLKKIYENKKLNIDGLILFKRENLLPKANKKFSDEIKKLWNLHFEKRYLSEIFVRTTSYLYYPKC